MPLPINRPTISDFLSLISRYSWCLKHFIVKKFHPLQRLPRQHSFTWQRNNENILFITWWSQRYATLRNPSLMMPNWQYPQNSFSISTKFLPKYLSTRPSPVYHSTTPCFRLETLYHRRQLPWPLLILGRNQLLKDRLRRRITLPLASPAMVVVLDAFVTLSAFAGPGQLVLFEKHFGLCWCYANMLLDWWCCYFLWLGFIWRRRKINGSWGLLCSSEFTGDWVGKSSFCAWIQAVQKLLGY